MKYTNDKRITIFHPKADEVKKAVDDLRWDLKANKNEIWIEIIDLGLMHLKKRSSN